jgi:ABC-type sugar transport system, periplasmic component
MKKTFFKLITLFVIMGLLLACVACGNSGQAPDTSKASTVANTNAASASGTTNSEPAEKVKMSVYHMYVDSYMGVEGVLFRDLIKQFPIDNPNVELTEEKVAHDIYMTKIQTLGASNDLPEVFTALPPLQQTFSSSGSILELNNILDSDSEWKGSFIDGAFDDHTVGGKILAIPYTSLLSHILFYNKDIFTKCGIDKFPSTLDEFRDAVVKIKAKGYIPLACGNKGKDPLASTIMPGLVFRYLDTTWYNSVRENKGAKFTDPEYIKAIDKLGELIKLGLFNSDLNSIDNTQARLNYYAKGKAAMFVWGSWVISQMIADVPKEILDQTEMAMIPPQVGKTELGTLCPGGTGWGWCISSKATGGSLDMAAKFLKAMTSKELQTKILDGGSLTAVKVTATDPAKLDPFFNKFLAFRDSVKMVPCPEIQLSALYVDASYTGYQDFSAGGITSKQLAEQLQKAMDDAGKQ